MALSMLRGSVQVMQASRQLLKDGNNDRTLPLLFYFPENTTA